MAIGDNISKVNDAANKVKEAAAQAKAKIEAAKAAAAAAKAKIEEAKAKVEAAKKKAKELADKAKKIKELALKQKEKLANLRKSLADKKNFLKDQARISPAEAKAVIIAVVLPILMKFINAEKIASLIVNQIINDTKRKLKNKGRVTVVNGAITFVPKDKANYNKFKADFDRKVNQLKAIIKLLKDIVDALMIILKVVKAATIAFKVYATILKIRLAVLAVKAAAESITISPAKPLLIKYLTAKQTYDDIIVPLNEKITNYGLIASSLTSMLKVYQRIINNIKAKFDTLKLTIITSPEDTTNNELVNIIDKQTNDELTDIEYSDGEKTYTIKVITTISGALQAVAYDKFSMLKITQTAPSKIRGADELVNELKQILG
jgi:hypothetical protein